MKAVADLLNSMIESGIITTYALFGATAQMRYTEAVATLDATAEASYSQSCCGYAAGSIAGHRCPGRSHPSSTRRCRRHRRATLYGRPIRDPETGRGSFPFLRRKKNGSITLAEIASLRRSIRELEQQCRQRSQSVAGALVDAEQPPDRCPACGDSTRYLPRKRWLPCQNQEAVWGFAA